MKADHIKIRAQLEAVRAAVNASLAVIAKDQGVDALQLARCSFDPDAGNFTFQLTGRFAGGLDRDQSRYDLQREFHSEGEELPPRDTQFADRGGLLFRIHGLSKTGAKLLCVKLTDGKTYNFDRERLVQQLRRTHAHLFPKVDRPHEDARARQGMGDSPRGLPGEGDPS